MLDCLLKHRSDTDCINKSDKKEETIEAAGISADSTAASAYLIFPTVISDTSGSLLFFLEK